MQPLSRTAIFFLLLLGAATARAGTISYEARVLKIEDGDTITVVSDAGRRIKIRLLGIDAPETGQPFGAASRRILSEARAGGRVRIEQSGVDSYGRALGRVLVPPAGCRGCAATVDVNLGQIESGMAWWYRQYARDQRITERGRYESAEAGARLAKRGLWADGTPEPPWEWRHARKPARAAPSAGGGTASRPPPGCAIKGNISAKGSRIYHVPGQRHYAKTRINRSQGERWFCSEREARAAGWRPARD
jgi:endonuclease YncB( thermonuclease family)